MDINYLVIEGNIGSGKTTLTKMISKKFGARMLLEGFEDNPFLPKFYVEQDKYAFPLEMSFLADRYNQLNKHIREFELFSSFLVSDYYFVKSLIFAQNTLREDEYQLYQRFFSIIYDRIPKPDLYVFLHQTPENLLKNIRKRGRDYEQNISVEYLSQIEKGYFAYFKQNPDFPILLIDTSNIDFVNDSNDFTKILGTIFDAKYAPGINRIILGE
ncbi:deoxynucleoside kinase [Mangrovibacterium diazotrophicum]|uniref:Deoxyadenosine/deoxycytidine kinase n=1 Tax=Mangrovibacterium diazotrophicum TaxID=1261403 RepID=A0A419WBA6_9BACT|nr:deoxynucleoside kinase [Mangrovibacterium diazotrophicum]RKD92737.1 deoxyadenosine/deoxycytidine kinase [Mangrovibacterium diazotrophicum]